MCAPRPVLRVVADPNGAGKTTAAADVLAGPWAVQEFVNADTVAKGLSAFQPERIFDAGRFMLHRLCTLRRHAWMWLSRPLLPAAPWLHGSNIDCHWLSVSIALLLAAIRR